MCWDNMGKRSTRFFCLCVVSVVCLTVAAGCQETDTLKRELLNKAQDLLKKKKNPFTPRDGITIRACSLYQTANQNSEVLQKLPAETPVHLMDKVGDWFRIRTREGREGYLDQKLVGGKEIILKTQELRKSIEGMPAQAEGVTKTRANFRLEPGREHEIIEVLPPGKKFEVYERVVTTRSNSAAKSVSAGGRGEGLSSAAEDASRGDETSDDVKKDVWYKVKIEDGRVGYLYTHNMKLTPPEDIARAVPFMRIVAWRSINVTDDPDRGAKNNYVVAYAPIGKDPGSDYSRLYLMNWSSKLNRRNINWQVPISGILPITDYHFEGKPGFSVRYLHPSKKGKLVLASYVFSGGKVRKISEEEIPSPSTLH
jgi:hypothetical protein